ncbi:MAG: T9SS type A sorting domain-containing protein [Bacteroidetes bacterium]|nr:T9SS type A sorting domain-containing protein [Bacteroidota bacterium]
MKKRNFLLILSMFFSISLIAVPTLTFRFVNPTIVRSGGFDYLQYDVQVKADIAGTYWWAMQIACTFNNTTILPAIGNWTLTPGALMSGTNSLSHNKYSVSASSVSGSVGSKYVLYALTGDAAVFGNGPNATDFNEMTTAYQTIATLKAKINDATLNGGITFRVASMNNQAFYVSAPSVGTRYTNPNLYDAIDINATYVGRLYSTLYGWSQTGNTVDGQWVSWTASVNTSIWEGSATITQSDNTPINPAKANNLRIENGSTFTVATNKYFTVATNLVNTGTTANFVINSGGSVIVNGTVTGNISQQQDIPAWTNNTDGWHFLSSPVAGQAISPNFIDPTATLYDFYGWGEATDLWLNYKAGSIGSNMVSGTGYLVAYGAAGTKTFSGAPNMADITLTNQSFTPAMAHHGWHLIGNPFQSSVTWNEGALWALANVQTSAARLNPGGTYSVLNAGDPLPAENGLMIWVSTGTNSLTIPKLSRHHNGAGWYKNSESAFPNYLMLMAASTTDNTYVETIVGFNTNSSAEYDLDYDCWFLSGLEGAPWMYSTTPGSSYLSANIMPAGIDSKVVPVGFKKGNAGSYTMTASWVESFDPGVTITLEDLKTQKTQDIVHNPVYAFTSDDGDVQNRFLLHFGGIFGIDDQSNDQSVTAYSWEHSIYVSNNTGKPLQGIIIYDMLGKELVSKGITEDQITKINLPGVPTGNYLVRVLTDQKPYTRSLFIH